MRVLPLGEMDAQWDRLAEDLEGSTFCHLMAWRQIMAEVLGHDTHYSVALDPEGRPEGLLPLVRVRSRLFGDYLLSMPFLSYGGPIGTPRAVAALLEHARDEALRLDVDLLELRSRVDLPGDLPVSDRKITVLLDLPGTADELWKDTLKSKVRSQIRRPQKEGMTARFGSDLVGPFYQVFSRTMRDLGTPVLPRRFFDAIAFRFPRQSIFCVVEHEGIPVAAGCGFQWGGEVEITWAGSLREYSRMAPNMLLYWAFTEESIRRGAGVFNFGRCTPGSGTHRFKSQWGGRDVPLPWTQWSPRGITATPSPDSAKFRLATAVWRKFPVGVANRLGPVLSRSLP